MVDLTRELIQVTQALGASYTLNGQTTSVDEIFKDNGLLPAIARRADQLCSLCLGYGIGVSFEDVEGSRLGVKAIFDDITPNVVRLMCIVDVLGEIIQNSPDAQNVSLDELMYE